MIRIDILCVVSVLMTSFDVNADSSSQTIELIECELMNSVSISLMASLVLRSVGIAYAYLVLMLINMRKYDCATVQEGPFEMSDDDLRTLDNNNAMVYDGMNLLVLFC